MTHSTTEAHKIVSKNWEGITCVLVDAETLDPIEAGSVRITFRGEPVRIESGAAPHKPSSTGTIFTSNAQYYPTVVNAKWIPLEGAQNMAS